MRKFKNVFTMFVIIVCSFLVSCSESEIEVCDEKESLFEVNDGIVYFNDIESFRTVMTQLHEMSDDELIEWENNNSFTNSLRKFQSENDDLEKEVIEDQVFATVINADGFFAIGDSLHKLTYSTEYVAHKDKLELLRSVDDKLKSQVILDSEIRQASISRINSGMQQKSKGEEYEYCPCYSDRRSELSCWCTNTLVYASVGAQIKGQKRNSWGNWKTWPIRNSSVKATATYTMNWSGEYKETASDSEHNCKICDAYFGWAICNTFQLKKIDAEFMAQHLECAEEYYSYSYIK